MKVWGFDKTGSRMIVAGCLLPGEAVIRKIESGLLSRKKDIILHAENLVP